MNYDKLFWALCKNYIDGKESAAKFYVAEGIKGKVLKETLKATKDYIEEINKKEATVQSIVDAKELKDAAANKFKMLYGMDWLF